MDWPDARLNTIETREDLVRHLEQMAIDVRRSRHRFEHLRTDDYVSAAGAWTRGMDGFFRNVMEGPVPAQPTWSMVAAIFSAALVYE
ncbi:DUF7660 family protein [Cellulomonas sp. NS3]|uniref:DUF7660 family protein n=1 Tax=Cellulomonas sp. NS3 TaxID=2973977 RepID=UPI0021638EDF|nr:hypothetical protein [Cellulomonas sp. NS3]